MSRPPPAPWGGGEAELTGRREGRTQAAAGTTRPAGPRERPSGATERGIKPAAGGPEGPGEDGSRSECLEEKTNGHFTGGECSSTSSLDRQI